MELRADGDRAVLVGLDGEIAPDQLIFDEELVSALREWARVVDVVRRTAAEDRDATGAVVSHRGRQLAARLAGELGTPVRYADPLTGETSTVDPPYPEAETVAPPREPVEPTPWGTGLTVTAIITVVVAFTTLVLAYALGETSKWISVGTVVVVTVGLLPSVWIARRTPIWRWVAFGIGAGVVASWIGLPFILAA
ncbi:uncharacterized protein DUF2537 [Herbihabitans rhizosphaerae]|uniref:Uncharacterized protein DUF2537 n=1 Tax=Herbihabitans rhizosphaerae TaxID=1872711 RepID=A0A4Q7KWM8_9PSEU|nr:DUF2537 domain-containing protein [Herbihabitans rhizosphaerae]RZS40996.1 uncharacterized protein DUF2537 [Herbihabitans rhizosphaerae]